MSSFVGIDIVHIPTFAEQLALSGSRFADVFSPRELRVAGTKPNHEEHLAGRWAAKEAFIKAWSQAYYGRPPLVEPDRVDWAEIEVVPDRWGRTLIMPRGVILEASGIEEVQVSVSHDGDYATAVCILERP
ncbi:holo-ACP synthase [Corynebacterium vitaeruminis]|uniref:holo-ACP synthase AcpS n=1 Tax=Corynebacterium vitaeruminis TaxID=38305 RepID=UPI000558A1F7|nr:holo-ACP synthase [Corynebacterium vitaeruminis]